MSEFIASAQVRIFPNTIGFRAQLQEQVNRAVAQAQILPINIPVVLGGTALAGAGAATAKLAAQQKVATGSTADLVKAAQIENTTFGRQAVILEAATIATVQKAGADRAATASALTHAAGMNQVTKAAIANTAAMAGLRGATLTAERGFILATVAFVALGKAVQSSIQFERQLNVFAETAGATASELERVSETARQLGRDITLPGVSAGDAAETLTLLSRAGLDVNESLGAVRGTLQLATAAQIENAEATTLVANALNAFKLEGEEAVRVADLFAGAANQSQGSISDMGIALRQASAAAAGLGLSVEDTLTLLTQLSRAGLSASDAGTSLRTGFLRLIQNLPKVNEEVERLGINFREVDGSIDPEFFEKVGQKLKTMDAASRQAAQANLGGADALRLYLLLGREAAGTFDQVQEAISEQGLAAELAAAQTEGLGGDVEGAKNQFSELGLTVGQLASGPLSLFVRTAGAAAGAINEVNRELSETAGGQGFGETAGNFFNRFAETFARINFQFRQGVSSATNFGESLTGVSAIMRDAMAAATGLGDALKAANAELQADQGRPQDAGLGVQQILNRVQGLDSAEVRARIRGDNEELLGVLADEQAFLQAQLDRQFVKNRPALQRQLENALLGVTNDLRAISAGSAADAKSAAQDAARAIQEADRALLDALSQRRDDAGRKIAAAADTEGVRDDIRRQDALQALIKIQIQKVRNRIADEKARRAAIRELRLALQASQREEEALRQQQREDAQARIDTVQELNIAIAEETGNDSALERAIRIRINRINKQIKAAKGDQVRIKQLILERERLKNQLDEGAEKEKETGKSAQQFFFEQLQAQQGFAANLLGNLITGPTAGLVGVPAPTGPGRGVKVAASAAEGKAAFGPTSGQANVTNDILLRILNQLKHLNGDMDNPEATRQRRKQHAVMDYDSPGFGGV